ncbi:hypothetical protein GWE18_30325 [Bradyrhizobium sp. CSA112]|uniref:hypothetical protein n=1 Tax=Bradyrhizobium sp. CSA112 TaxID=2699170 RepID=UPI0023B09739|nr:hypothetical protein [Bradyrhizobium sp. CSA112]MDE5457049.1 hypothetical protein [Bradyrhizobium sp. CSA112]
MTPPIAVGKRVSRVAWWKRAFHSVAAMAGLIVAGAEAKASPVAAASGEYRSATAVPEAWQVFARQLQQKFEQQLAGDSDGARRIQDYLMRRGGEADAPALRLALRAWVLTDGKVSRVEVDGMDDGGARVELRALLMAGGVGAPPPEMLQPLHLRLSLRAKDRSREGK